MSGPGKDTSRAQILVVEDSSVFREMQGLLLRQAGFAACLHENPGAALSDAAKQKFDLVVIDYELPDMNGEQFMHALRRLQPEIPAIFVSGSLTQELIVRLTTQNVAGLFHKPTNPKQLLEKISETLSRAARDTAVRAGSTAPVGGSSAKLAAPPVVEPSAHGLAYEPLYVPGHSDAFREFTHRLWKVRDFRSTLLLQGEPGSAFELFARELAGISLFREGPVMLCDVADFEPRRLIEVLAPSLLSQDAGTLIVTGVEQFTADQQKTLENLTTGRDVFLPFARRFRLVLAATPRLAERVEDGSFGDVLFYKISSLSLTIPTLRAMRSDILANAQHILQQHRNLANAATPTALTAEAATWVEAQDWPGNYAELSSLLLLAASHATGEELDVAALQAGWQEYYSSRPVPVVEEASSDTPAPFATAPAAVVDLAPLVMPASQPAKATASVRVLAGKSLFRPASVGYDFSKRLADSIAVAEAVAS
jgi:DNA-binding NtrC family response regulator